MQILVEQARLPGELELAGLHRSRGGGDGHAHADRFGGAERVD